MFSRKLYFFFLIILIQQVTFAQDQNLNNLRIKKIPVTKAQYKFDTTSVVPNSFSVLNSPPTSFYIDEKNSTLIWLEQPQKDSVYVKYRILPFVFNKKYKHLDYEEVRYRFTNNYFDANIKSGKNEGNSFFDFNGLQTEGSFGRSISFGNNQDASINSSMNFQVSGYIGDSLKLLAAISDDNIPIQPDGNTKDLRDFDRIFLQVSKRNWQVSFGDIDLKENKNYFLNFYKRIQGVSFSSSSKIKEGIENSYLVSGAISKGKYTRNTIDAVEGNQGPYRLKGANNELYFVILAGTERVFIDGELLERGENEDYTINYNSAELMFTPKRIITKDSRIIVEFQYADRNYLNTQLFATDEIKINNKFSINLSAYSNADSKNATIDQDISDSQKQFLSTIGDSVQNAYATIAYLDTLSIGKILYKKIDTIYNSNIRDSIFVQSNDNNLPLYNVTFAYMGPGKGNYKQSLEGSNSKVYLWIQPNVNNEKQGDFEPVSFLVTPKKHNIYAFGLNFNLTKRLKVRTEMALSNCDVNLFSTKDKKDNLGTAGKINLNKTTNTFKLFSRNQFLEFDANYEFVKKEFKPIERLRGMEFYRNWNIANDFVLSDEMLSDFVVNLKSEKGGFFQYKFSNFQRNEGYNGIQNTLVSNIKFKSWSFYSNVMKSVFLQDEKSGDFLRPTFSVYNTFRTLRNIRFGVTFSSEVNKLLNKSKDTFLTGSNAFYKFEAKLESDSNKSNKWKVGYFNRTDYLPLLTQLIKSDESNNYSAGIILSNNLNHQLSLTVNYRSLHVHNSTLSNLKDDKTLLGRSDYYFNMVNGFMKGNLFYEIGTGQEQKREFSYVSVPVGLGEYTWIDYNSNGVEELNEFEIALFQDQKKYIRIYTPTNEYVKANTLQFNYNFELTPSQIMSKNTNRLARIISNITTNTLIQISKKKITKNGFDFNPFENQLIDTSLVYCNAKYTNSIFYNRINYKWGLDLIHNKSESSSLLTYGIEKRNQESLIGRLRLGLNRNFTANITFKNVGNILSNENSKFYNRNYDIRQLNYEPSFTYMYKSKFRATFGYNYIIKANQIDSLEKSFSHSLITELKYNIYSNTSITIKGSYNEIRFNAYEGAANSTVGYVLLEGLAPGKNYIWNFDLVKRFSGNIEINLQYEGRKSENSKIINIGRASLRAVF